MKNWHIWDKNFFYFFSSKNYFFWAQKRAWPAQKLYILNLLFDSLNLFFRENRTRPKIHEISKNSTKWAWPKKGVADPFWSKSDTFFAYFKIPYQKKIFSTPPDQN